MGGKSEWVKGEQVLKRRNAADCLDDRDQGFRCLVCPLLLNCSVKAENLANFKRHLIAKCRANCSLLQLFEFFPANVTTDQQRICFTRQIGAEFDFSQRWPGDLSRYGPNNDEKEFLVRNGFGEWRLFKSIGSRSPNRLLCTLFPCTCNFKF